jgi:hypothetical protein
MAELAVARALQLIAQSIPAVGTIHRALDGSGEVDREGPQADQQHQRPSEAPFSHG